MKYYEAHDREYKKRLEAGQVAWDKGAYEKFDMLPFVEDCLLKVKFNPSSPSALDLGCGTGALALFLAKQGFNVTGVDISPTAINEAKKHATAQHLKINFQVLDMCKLDISSESFDLITDNHFLHCIVFEEERKRILGIIFNLLKPDGQYWIETMVGHPDMKPRAECNLDSEGISWHVVDDEEKEMAGCIKREGEIWFPIRKISISTKILSNEIRDAGFEILWQKTIPPKDENDTGSFRARCCKQKSSNNQTHPIQSCG